VHHHHCQSILTGLQADFEALRCTPIVDYFGASAERSERSHRREGTASAIKGFALTMECVELLWAGKFK